jgi:hypothetical protein
MRSKDDDLAAANPWASSLIIGSMPPKRGAQNFQLRYAAIPALVEGTNPRECCSLYAPRTAVLIECPGPRALRTLGDPPEEQLVYLEPFRPGSAFQSAVAICQGCHPSMESSGMGLLQLEIWTASRHHLSPLLI